MTYELTFKDGKPFGIEVTTVNEPPPIRTYFDKKRYYVDFAEWMEAIKNRKTIPISWWSYKKSQAPNMIVCGYFYLSKSDEFTAKIRFGKLVNLKVS